MSGALDQIEAHLNDDIVFAAQNLGNPVGNPSARTAVSAGTSGAHDRACWGPVTNFLMTCRLTFCMSTFWLNSAGNLVDFKSRASPAEAIVACCRDKDTILAHASVGSKEKVSKVTSVLLLVGKGAVLRIENMHGHW